MSHTNAVTFGRPSFIHLEDEEPAEIHDQPEVTRESAEANPPEAEAPRKGVNRETLKKIGKWGGVGVAGLIIAVSAYEGISALQAPADRRVSAMPETVQQHPQGTEMARQRQAEEVRKPAPAPAETSPAPHAAPASTPLQGSQAAAVPPPPAEARRPAAAVIPPDQVQILDLITATNRNLAQWRTQIEQQTTQIADLKRTVEDLTRRVSMAEATSAVSAANPAAPAKPVAAAVAAPVVASAPSTDRCAVRPHYTISSVSPSYVTLAGGDRPLIDLEPKGRTGDPAKYHVPCYGDILEITQKGTQWIVKFDHDVISSD